MEPTPANAAARKKTNADSTTLRGVIGIWIFVLLWNGSFGGVIWLIVTSPGAGIEWHKVAMVSPFVLVGLGIIYVLMPWTLKFFRQRARAKPPANPNQVGELGLGPESVDRPIASSLLQPTAAPARNTAASDMKGSSVDRQPRSLNVRLGTFIYTKLFPLPFFLAGLALLYLAGQDFNVAHKSNQWPNTIGKIELSGVKENWSTGSGISKRMYSANIKYRFIANKAEYVGDRVDFGSAGSMGRSVDADARALVSRYPPGEEVRVYYNPENPQEAVLEPGFATRSWMYALGGLVFLSVGLACFFYLPKLFRRRSGFLNNR